MSFLRVDTSHLRVPGKLDLDEMAFLAALAEQVPPDGHIVEIGPFYGRSTNVLARANPTAQITSVDTFEPAPWTDHYANSYDDIPAFSADAFQRFTSDLPNTRAVAGPSPDIARDWDTPIDMYFEDAVHGNPVLHDNITFWTAHLKPGGIAAGHDYTLRFPDVKREVDALAASWGTEVHVVGSLWALRKPSDAPTKDLRRALQQGPNLCVRTRNSRAGARKTLAGYWCGAHLEADRLSWVQIDPVPELAPHKLEYRLHHPRHGTTDWTPAGTRLHLISADGKARPFTHFAARLAAKDGTPAQLTLGYRVSARQIGGGGHRLSGTTPWRFDGDWAHVTPVGPALNALTIALFAAPPPDAQAAFTPKMASKPLQQKVIRRVKGTLKASLGKTYAP